jgi:hypothetical protein
MIRITQQASAKSAKSYYATADYYSEGQELVGANSRLSDCATISIPVPVSR